MYLEFFVDQIYIHDGDIMLESNFQCNEIQCNTGVSTNTKYDPFDKSETDCRAVALDCDRLHRCSFPNQLIKLCIVAVPQVRRLGKKVKCTKQALLWEEGGVFVFLSEYFYLFSRLGLLVNIKDKRGKKSSRVLD